MSIMDDYKQLRMIENIKNLKEMEIAYKANLKLCKYQEQQINKLATCIEEIKEIAEICKCHNADGCYECKYFDDCEVEDEEIPTRDVCKLILQKISECEVENEKT